MRIRGLKVLLCLNFYAEIYGDTGRIRISMFLVRRIIEGSMCMFSWAHLLQSALCCSVIREVGQC